MIKKRDDFNEWMDDFSDFLGAEAIRPPQQHSDRLHEIVFNALNPSPLLVFVRLALIAMMASSVTLLFCPQFGLGTSGAGLMPYLMKISPLACQFGCGVLFVGVGVLAATFLLKREEIRVLKDTKYLQVGALSGVMLGVFICFGSAQFFALEWAWLLGGLTGGVVSVYGGSLIRYRLVELVEE